MGEALIREIQELRLLMGSSADPQGRVFAQLGDALRRSGALDEARDVLLEGLASHPHFSPGHLAMAWIALDRRETEEALGCFEEVLRLDPDNPLALLGAGRLLAARGEARGVAMVERAEELDPGVHARVPGGADSPDDQARTSGDAARALEDLPFLPLAELAPVSAPPEATPRGAVSPEAVSPYSVVSPDVAELPFVPLAELAPALASPEAASPYPVVSPHEAELPFVPLAELAPQEGIVEPVAEVAAEDATPRTRTMAELLASQGFTDRAVAVYEELLAVAPGDPALSRRLEELRTASSGRPREPEPEDEPAMASFDADKPEGPAAPGLYGWTGDAEATDLRRAGGGTAADYFGRLLAWTAGNPAREADEATGSRASRDVTGERLP
ncbi:MAG: tetratricopeptide repeat protein [Longimicrobiales bacterium]|nr:tetratricopeptide repeat protein [Longimicrobiales bacterium]